MGHTNTHTLGGQGSPGEALATGPSISFITESCQNREWMRDARLKEIVELEKGRQDKTLKVKSLRK